MTKPESRKGGGAKTSRSETVTVRLDPRLRYLAEIAARVQRRTLSSYIESAVEASLQHVYLDEQQEVTVAASAPTLWFVSEPARLVRLHKFYPHLCDIGEQRLVRAAKQASTLFPQALTGQDEREKVEELGDILRPYWELLKQCAEDDVPMKEILRGVQEIKEELDGSGPVTLERIRASREKVQTKYDEQMAFLAGKEQEVQTAKKK